MYLVVSMVGLFLQLVKHSDIDCCCGLPSLHNVLEKRDMTEILAKGGVKVLS